MVNLDTNYPLDIDFNIYWELWLYNMELMLIVDDPNHYIYNIF